MASRSGPSSGSGFHVGLGTTQQYAAWNLPSPTSAASRPPAPSSSSPLPLPLPLPSFRRSSRPPALSAAALFSASVPTSAQNPASGFTAPRQRQQQQQPQQQRYASSTLFQTSRPSASTAPAISAASAAASASASASASAAAVAASSPLLISSPATARPILPPLPQFSPLSRYSTPRRQRHSVFSPSIPAAASAPASASLSHLGPDSITGTGINPSATANPYGLSTLQPDPFSPLNSPFDRPPPLFSPQATTSWSAYLSQLSQSDGWPQDDAALDRLLSENPFAPFTSQRPPLQSPSQLPQSRFGRFQAPSPASASSSATAILATLSPLTAAATSATTAPSAQFLPRNNATRPSRISSGPNTASHPAVPSFSEQGFPPLHTFGGFPFPSGNSDLDGIFCDFDDFPGFPVPFTDTPGASVSSSFNTMPTTSGRLRGRAPPDTHGSSAAAAAPARKRRRISPSAAPPTSAQSAVIEDDLDDIDSLFGSSPSRPASANSKAEDYTTIDLTEATDVPEELKKPEVDKRVKLSAFQCVICMDDVTGLTLTHCGHLFCAQCLHSSLSIETTRGKCPMCRAKIDMKSRATYTTKTKGYWPLELKLMTRTRQGKRKAPDTE
ncbi:hypothetical protein J3F83DRAFT_559608 [Trichoderma novae-zelandiae]